MNHKYAQYFVLLTTVILFYVSRLSAQEFSRAIEDNSFFIEEAFNQEEGIMQHITNGYFQSRKKEYTLSFTDEWPIGSQIHQLSITIPYESTRGGSGGLSDLSINYRYQLWDDKDWCWISPRLSIILPTGKSSEDLGD
jgi:hypothetical protein